MTPSTSKDLGKGPGDILAYYLKTFKVAINEGCNSCTYHRDKMNQWGPDLCLIRVDTIVRWLRLEAFNRSLPFDATAAKLLVIYCCKKSKKLLTQP